MSLPVASFLPLGQVFVFGIPALAGGYDPHRLPSDFLPYVASVETGPLAQAMCDDLARCLETVFFQTLSSPRAYPYTDPALPPFVAVPVPAEGGERHVLLFRPNPHDPELLFFTHRQLLDSDYVIQPLRSLANLAKAHARCNALRQGRDAHDIERLQDTLLSQLRQLDDPQPSAPLDVRTITSSLRVGSYGIDRSRPHPMLRFDLSIFCHPDHATSLVRALQAWSTEFPPDKKDLELFERNGVTGTCVHCPRSEDGKVYPERCMLFDRQDHQLGPTR